MEPRDGLGVFQDGVTKNFPAKIGQTGIILDQFSAGVDVIVVVVVLAVVVEPALHAFGEVFVMVDRSVLALPKPGFHGRVVSLFDTSIEAGVDVGHATQ